MENAPSQMRLLEQVPRIMRNAEDLLHDRDIEVIHETVRFWWNRFDPVPGID